MAWLRNWVDGEERAWPGGQYTEIANGFTNNNWMVYSVELE